MRFLIRVLSGGGNSFCIKSSYSQSKFLTLNDTQKLDFARQTNENLSSYSNLAFKFTRFGTHFVDIQNDLKCDLDSYFNALYKKIQYLFYKANDLDIEKALISAIFALNGSADFKLNLYAVDIYSDFASKNYIDKYFKLILNLNQNYYLNLNFRELQKQYLQGIHKRNGQFRVNLAYVCENLEPLNAYKIAILKQNKDKIYLKECKKSQILERFRFYLKEIVGKKDIDEQKLRKELEFDKDKSGKITRDNNLKNIAKFILPQECAACSTKYELKNRTFKTNNDEFYLEIHHNIAFAENKMRNDSLENLVKLCPACHKALSFANENYQKELISSILTHSKEAKEFAQNISQARNDSELVNFIYESLR